MQPRHSRALWARTNHANRGFKDNTPDAWVDTNGPVWWVGNDKAYLGSPAAGASAITKATSIIVNRLAATDWKVSDGSRKDWLTDPMRVRTHPGTIPENETDLLVEALQDYPFKLPRSYFWGQWIRSALLYGMGYFVKSPNPGGMLLIDPRYVSHDDSGETLAIFTPEGGTFPVGPNGELGDIGRLVTLRNPMLPMDYQTGKTPGVLEYHALELGLQNVIADYTSGVFTGGGVPTGYLKASNPQMTPEDAKELKADWNAAHANGRRGTAVLSAAMSYEPIAVSPVDAALADMTKLSLVSVANAFCVPLYMLGAPSGDSMTYSSVPMEQEALWTHTLYAWRAAVIDTLAPLLPFNVDLVIEGAQTNANGNGTGATTNGVSPQPADVS